MRAKPVLRAVARARLSATDSRRLRCLVRQAVRTPLRDGDLPPDLCSSFRATYSRLSAAGQRSFLGVLAEHLDSDDRAVSAAASALVLPQEAEARLLAHDAMRQALTPLHELVLHAVGRQQGGLPFLVSLRADVLRALADERARGTASSTAGTSIAHHGGEVGAPPPPAPLSAVSASLLRLLSYWFDGSSLELRRVEWDSSPAALLERLMRYERVHAMEGWDDLHARLGPRGRVFALTHAQMPLEPLVFVQVALLDRAPTCLADVLPYRDADGHFISSEHLVLPAVGHPEEDTDQVEEPKPAAEPTAGSEPRVAVFYSISSPHEGLRGVPLGRELLMRAIGRMRQEEPLVGTFMTLSPVPGFRSWLSSRWERRQRGEDQSEAAEATESEAEAALLSSLEEALAQASIPFGGLFGPPTPVHADTDVAPPRASQSRPPPSTAHAAPPPTPTAVSAPDACLRGPVVALVVRYLLVTQGRWRDPVAHFHQRNGARLSHVHWAANMAGYAMAQSAGVMVSYSYQPEKLAANRAAYLATGRVLATRELASLLPSRAERERVRVSTSAEEGGEGEQD